MSYFKTVKLQDGSGNSITSTASALDVNLASGGVTTVTANLGTIADVATQTTLAAMNTKLVTGTDIGDVTINNASGASAVNVQDGGNTITVDGTVNAAQNGTWNVTNVSGTVSLPTGAATSANQSTEITSLQLIDDSVATTGSAITAKGIAAAGTDGTNARVLKTDTSGELQVDVLTMPSTTVTATNLDIRDLSSASDSVSVAQATAASLKGQMILLDAAGTNLADIHADGSLMTGPLQTGMQDYIKRFSNSVATGNQTITIDSDTTSRAVKEIYVGANGFGEGAFFDFKRGATTIGSIYPIAANFIVKDKLDASTSTLTADMNTGNAGTITVYFVVKYHQA